MSRSQPTMNQRPTPTQVFADETKERGFRFVAVALPHETVEGLRRELRDWIKPGQTRIHCSKESDARRKQVIDLFAHYDCEVVVYDSSALPKRQRREACLHKMVELSARSGASLLVLERDDSTVEFDKKLLYRRVRELGCEHDLQYRHLQAREEPSLIVPDVIAWCLQRGGEWYKRVEPLITAVYKL